MLNVDADLAVAYLSSGQSSLRAIVLYRLTSNEVEQIKNTKISIRHIAVIGNDIENYLETVSVITTDKYILMLYVIDPNIIFSRIYEVKFPFFFLFPRYNKKI